MRIIFATVWLLKASSIYAKRPSWSNFKKYTLQTIFIQVTFCEKKRKIIKKMHYSQMVLLLKCYFSQNCCIIKK